MTTITDSKGTSAGVYSNLGVTLGQPGLIDNDSDTAVRFDGVSGTGQLPAFNLGNGPFSVEVWFRRAAFSTTYAPVIVALDNGFRVCFNPSSWPTSVDGLLDGFTVEQGTVTDYSNVAVADTTLKHHLVVTKLPNAPGGVDVNIYLDGTNVSVRKLGATVSNGYNAHTWLASNNGVERFCPIVLDESAIYGVALTATQVSAHWQNGAATLITHRGAVAMGTTNNISTAGATFNGTVNANGTANTNFWFEYGPTLSYGSKSGVFVFSDNAPHSVSQFTAATFTVGIPYHVRLVASNSFGITYTADSTFAVPSPPIILQNQPSALTDTTATLSGSINPIGAPTTYHFEYGPTTAYGSQVPATDASLGTTDASAQPVSQIVSGLTLNTTYHARLSATNTFGTSNSLDRQFTTTGGPVTPVSFQINGTVINGPTPSQVFVPMGAAVATKHSFDGMGSFTWCNGHSDDALAWNWNIVRLSQYVSDIASWSFKAQEGYAALLANTQAIIDEYTSKKIVVILGCWDIGVYTDWYWTTNAFDQVLQFTSDMATANINNPRVWFEPGNEFGPGTGVDQATSDAAWVTKSRQLIDTVRNTGSNNIVVIDLPGSAEDVGWFPYSISYTGTNPTASQLLAGNHNVLLAQHNYEGYDDAFKYGVYLDNMHSHGYPVMMGEAGYATDGVTATPGGWTKNRNCQVATFTAAPPRGVGIIVWHGTYGLDKQSLKQSNNPFWADGGPGLGLSDEGTRYWNLCQSLMVVR